MSLRQRVPQSRVAEPTALQRQIRPAQAGVALAAQNQVDAATPRVGVDEQRIGAPICANAVAKTEAPAPPRPAITPTTAPRRSSSRHASAASDSSAINSPSCAGSVMTCCAPTAMAAWKSAASGSERTTRTTRARRGSARCAQRRAAATSSNTATAPVHALRPDGSDAWTTGSPTAAATRSTSSRSAGVADQRQDSVACGHDLSLQRADDIPPSWLWHLWMNANLGTNLTNAFGMSAFENNVPQLPGDEERVPNAKETP